ncbi:MAG: metallophosphoesterase, partial [Paraclostridium sp.]
LVLTGHVHGGIIRLPIVGGLLSPNREFFPKYDFGKYEKNDTTMLLSKGLGGSKVLIRIACKPEIVSITLKSE